MDNKATSVWSVVTGLDNSPLATLCKGVFCLSNFVKIYEPPFVFLTALVCPSSLKNTMLLYLIFLFSHQTEPFCVISGATFTYFNLFLKRTENLSSHLTQYDTSSLHPCYANSQILTSMINSWPQRWWFLLGFDMSWPWLIMSFMYR